MSFNLFANRIIRPEELSFSTEEKNSINDILSLINHTLGQPHLFNHHKIQFLITGYTLSLEVLDDGRITKINQLQINCIKKCLEESGWHVYLCDKKFAHDLSIELSTDKSGNQVKTIKLSKINGAH